MNSNEINHYCILCSKPSMLFCQRCGDCYCSTVCQYRDWPSHRYICFTMPPLIRSQPNIVTAPQELIQPLMSLNVSAKANGLVPNQGNWSYNNQNNRPVTQQQQQVPQQTHQMPAQQQPSNHQQQPPLQQHKNQNPQQPKQQSPSIITEIPKEEYPINGSEVILTGHLKTNICYIRSKDPKIERTYKQIRELVNSGNKQRIPLKVPPRNNTYVLASFNNGDLGRALILGKLGNKFRLLLIDLGKESMRQQNELYVMPEEIARLKQCVLPVILNQVPQKLNNNNEVYENKTYKIEYIEPGKAVMPTVNLINVETQQSLNVELCSANQNSEKTPTSSKANPDLNSANRNLEKTPNPSNANHEATQSEKNSPSDQMAKCPSPPASVCSNTSKTAKSPLSNRLQKALSMAKTQQMQPVLNPPFKFKLLTEGETNVKVVIMDTSVMENGVFGCVRADDLPHVNAILKYCSDEYKPGTEPYKPVLNEYCMAFFEDKWYRAQCVAIEGDIYTAFYIDFTNEEKVTKDKLRPYPMDFTLDCRTVTCAVGELENMNEQQLEFLAECGISPFSSIVIEKVINGAEGFFFVELNEIIEKMRKSKLL